MTRASGNAEVRTLIEPLAWSVRAALDLAAYPGELTLGNLVGEPEAMILTGEAALRGLDGTFVPDGGTLRHVRANGGDRAFRVVAGSMEAYRDAEQGYRDQRGLFRRASATAGPHLVKTPVSLQTPEALACYELASLLAPLDLWAGAARWGSFWFRDLPLKQADQTFVRAETVSPEAREKETDVNDPDALGREWNFLAGYQWGLVPSGANPRPAAEVEPLLLGALHFFPLTLERLALDGGEIARMAVVGRLQLPLPGKPELADLGNAVEPRLRAQRREAPARGRDARRRGGPPEGAPPAGAQGQWPLELAGTGPAGGEGDASAPSDAPLLTWTGLSFKNDALVVQDAHLEFFLFDAPWKVGVGPLAFPLGSTAGPRVARPFDANPGAALQAMRFDLQLSPHGRARAPRVQRRAARRARRAPDGCERGPGRSAARRIRDRHHLQPRGRPHADLGRAAPVRRP